MDQERTRQVDESRWGVLPTTTRLWLLTVHCSVTPGGQSFRRRQQRLPKCQQIFN